jgi:uncharacterized protein
VPALRRNEAAVTTDFAAPLSDKERDELEVLIESNYPDGTLGGAATCLHGFFTSVISGPLIKPTEWLEVVFGDSYDVKWDRDHLHRATDLIMRFNNEVAAGLVSDDFGVLLQQPNDESETEIRADEWCRGYIVGMSLRSEEWKPAIEDDAISPFISPIVAIADPEETGLDKYLSVRKHYDEALILLPSSAVAIYNWWRERFKSEAKSKLPERRTTPKISPNALCPCGSGKKYKRCCSPNRAS